MHSSCIPLEQESHHQQRSLTGACPVLLWSCLQHPIAPRVCANLVCARANQMFLSYSLPLKIVKCIVYWGCCYFQPARSPLCSLGFPCCADENSYVQLHYSAELEIWLFSLSLHTHLLAGGLACLLIRALPPSGRVMITWRWFGLLLRLGCWAVSAFS